MLKTKLLNENAVEIAKVYVLLNQTGKLLDKVFSLEEIQDPNLLAGYFNAVSGMFQAIYDSLDMLQRNTDRLTVMERELDNMKN